MRHFTLIIIAAAIPLLGGCNEKAAHSSPPAAPEVKVHADKPLIRSFRFVGTHDDYGIELNGQQGFLHQEGDGRKLMEVPAEKVIALIEGFYGIPDIESFRGKKSDNRQSALQYLVAVYDEAEGRYSEEYVDYVIPKDSIESGSPFHRWLKGMEALRSQANSQQAKPDSSLPAARFR